MCIVCHMWTLLAIPMITSAQGGQTSRSPAASSVLTHRSPAASSVLTQSNAQMPTPVLQTTKTNNNNIGSLATGLGTQMPTPVLQTTKTDNNVGSLAAGLVFGILIIIALVVVLIVLVVLLYLQMKRENNKSIARNTTEGKDELSVVVGPSIELHTKPVPSHNAWREEAITEKQEIVVKTTVPDRRNTLIGPSRIGMLVKVTDSSNFVLKTNPLFEPEEGESPLLEFSTELSKQSTELSKQRKIKPDDISYKVGDMAVSPLPSVNLVPITEALIVKSQSSSQDTDQMRKRCLTGPLKPSNLAKVSESALIDIAWTSNHLYSSLENIEDNIYDVPCCDDAATEDHVNSDPADNSIGLLKPGDNTSNDVAPSSVAYVNSSEIINLEDSPIYVKDSNIREVEFLGIGHFGNVILAETVGLNPSDLHLSSDSADKNTAVKVVVKKLKPNADQTTQASFEKEIKFTSRLKNENVVRLLAIHEGSDHTQPFMMLEYTEHGDLHQFLQTHKFSRDAVRSDELSLSTIVNMATNIANGMRYLASFNFVHSDLAARNCLVGRNYVVKIIDFGVIRPAYSSVYYGSTALPIRWMATESFQEQFSEKSDVWSFGVVMWEIFNFAQRVPYEEMGDEMLVEDASCGENRTLLPKPATCPQELYDVMLWCWAHDPSQRPTFEGLHQALLQHLDDLRR